MGSFQSFKWPHFVILRDEFKISRNIYSTAQEPYFLAEIRWLHDYTYLTFTSNGNNRCKVEKIYK
jgi:hypothetical protein